MPQGKELKSNVPPIIEKMSGDDPAREAPLVMAYNLLRMITATGLPDEANRDNQEQLDELIRKHPWLEQEERSERNGKVFFSSPLRRLRIDINHSPLPWGV